ncbi:MAG: RDD family protein [Myxococcota bacterium]|nr:RDD family protein [Myxococcota bacterium]
MNAADPQLNMTRRSIVTAALRAPDPHVYAAPFWRRMTADSIDFLCLVGIARLTWLSHRIQPTLSIPPQFDWIDAWAERLGNHPMSLVLWLCVTLVIHFVATYGMRCLWSASAGERLLGLTLVGEGHASLTLTQNLLHYAFTCLGCLCGGVGYLWALIDRRRQTLANYGSRTTLICR